MPDFATYERLVTEYGRSWWRKNQPALDMLELAPDRRQVAEEHEARGVPVETAVVYQADDGSWEDGRPGLHQVIVNTVIGTLAPPPPVPILAVTMGVPGSGKSSALRPLVAGAIGADVSIVDADAVRAQCPEYMRGYGSEVVQIETVEVTYGEVLHRARAGGSHVIIDTVGRIEHLREYRDQFPDHRLHLLCAELPIDLAVERTQQRALTDGRYVRETVVRSAARRPREAFDAGLKEGLADEWALVDTSTMPAKVVAASGLYGPVGRTL